MPVGGSITYGSKSSDGNGYRKFLHDLLIADGLAIDMVGSRRSGTAQLQHEGWRGFRIEQIQAKAITSATKYIPDIITLNAGSNDCRQDFGIESAGKRVETLMRGLWEASPTSTIVLGTLVRTENLDTDGLVRRVNDQLHSLAGELTKSNCKFVLADMHTNGPAVQDLADGTHPNNKGYEKMARQWHDAISEAHRNGYLV